MNCSRCNKGMSHNDLEAQPSGQKPVCIACREQLARDVREAKRAWYREGEQGDLSF